MMTHTFLVDIAHRPSSIWTFSINNLGGMNKEYEEFLRQLGKDINDPFNLPFCSNPEEMYSFVLTVFIIKAISVLLSSLMKKKEG